MTQTLPERTAAAPDRAAHLAEVLGALYPSPCRIGAPESGDEPVAEYRIVPSRKRPRLLVPARRRLAAAGLRLATRRGSAAGRLAVRLGAAGLTVPGAARVLLRDTIRVHAPAGADTFSRYASGVLAMPACDLVVYIGGAARANRKPVAALLDPSGNPVGFAKLGIGELSRVLVINERRALTRLAEAGLRHTVIPDLLHAGGWRGYEVLLQSALPVWEPPGPGDATVLADAMVEVAGAAGVARSRLADSAYWSRLRARIAAAPDPGRLGYAAESLHRIAGEVPLAYGAWHGDWTPWNSCRLGSTMLVWDWERHATGVPLGFDALHHRLATHLAARKHAPGGGQLLHTALLAAPEALAPFGVSPRQAHVTAALYVVEIATRYLTDGQRNAAARAITEQLLPAVARELLAALTQELLPALRGHLAAKLEGDAT